MMELTKAQKKGLRELMELGWEHALDAELAKLDESFAKWKARELNAFELSDQIHTFHNGPAREVKSIREILGAGVNASP